MTWYSRDDYGWNNPNAGHNANGDTAATLQYRFSGAVKGACHFIIANGKLSAREGACEDPDLTIDTPFDLWMDIMTGKADGQKMFMAQRYTVAGDLGLLMQMGKLFAR